MAFRKNPTDKDQSDIESANFDSGIPVFDDAKTRSIPAGDGGAAPRTSHDAGSYHSNAGVAMPFDDKPNRFYEEQAGKA